jgi:hypothetical protein
LKARLLFRSAWRLSNLLLAAAVVATIRTGVGEFSVRQFRQRFSDAVVPETQDPTNLSPRDHENTLNYRQVSQVCGSARAAFFSAPEIK